VLHQARLLVKDKSLGTMPNAREEYLGKSQVDPRASFELETLSRNYNRKQGPQWYSTIPAQGETRHSHHIARYKERHIIQDPLRLSAILPSLQRPEQTVSTIGRYYSRADEHAAAYGE
jgi:hypothetical protein